MKTLRHLTFLFLLLAGTLRAEVVHLKNGEVVQGRITTQTTTHLTILAGGVSRFIPKNTVRRIIYDTDPEAKRLVDEQRQRQLAYEEARKRREKEEAILRLKEEVRLARTSAGYQQAQVRAARARIYRELVAAKKIEKPPEPIGFFDFAWRSIVLPGWGHFYLGKPIIGTTYAVLTAGAIVNVAVTYGPAKRAQQENNQNVIQNYAVTLLIPGGAPELKAFLMYKSNLAEYNREQTRVDAFNRAPGILAFVYGLQLLHIIFNGLAWERGLIVHGEENPQPFHLAVYSAPSLASTPGQKPAYDTYVAMEYRF